MDDGSGRGVALLATRTLRDEMAVSGRSPSAARGQMLLAAHTAARTDPCRLVRGDPDRVDAASAGLVVSGDGEPSVVDGLVSAWSTPRRLTLAAVAPLTMPRIGVPSGRVLVTSER